MTKAQKAAQEFESGYNCCQAVLLAFHEELGLSRETAAALGSSFGGGVSRSRELCGAVSGVAMVIGLKDGYTDPLDTDKKATQYELTQGLLAQFTDRNGSIVCRELLELVQKSDPPTPSARTEEYYATRPCAKLVYDAAQIVENALFQSTVTS